MAVAEQFDVKVSRRAKHEELVDTLMSARSVQLDDVLPMLSRDELRAICDTHGLDRSGRAKATLTARILGDDAKSPASESPTRPAGGTNNPNGNGGVLGFENELWSMADQLWTNSALQPGEYSTPILALIFLKYADHRFAQVEAERAAKQRRRRVIAKNDDLGRGVLYVPEDARFQRLLEMPEDTDLGKAVNDAMKAIEAENPELKDTLPKTFAKFERTTLASLLKIFGNIPPESSGDVFGRIYEYFLGKLAPRTLQKGGEYFTPESVVKLIVEIVEPFHGRILDPACGSGGMFIQSARFIENHKKNPAEEISIHGIEKIEQTLQLAKMSLAVHGLSGDIRDANTYYEDPHDCVGNFDFVLANPPFNQKAVDKARVKDDTRRFPFGMPASDNANALWIQLFFASLNARGRAGFVMANSAGDPRGSELEIQQRLLETGTVDVILALGPNFFYTVTLPATLWFLDRAKPGGPTAGSVLFIDARDTYRQVDRAHRDFAPEQREFLANIVRLYRGNACENRHGGEKLLKKHFPRGRYCDVPGLCKRASLKEIEEQGWSLNPGRYVGVGELAPEAFDFWERFDELSEQLESLNVSASALEARIAEGVAAVLKGRRPT